MIKAIIFDMDGLLIDSEVYWNEARRIMADKAEEKWNDDDHQAVMGVSTHEWVSYMIDRLSLDMSPGKVEETVVMTMRELFCQRIPFHPGAEQAVTLSNRHYPTGLASGSPQSLINIVTNTPALRGKFQVVLSGDQVQQGKPSPDIYLFAAKALKIPPENCVCLEDSGNGILAGKNAGMKVIAVPDPRFLPPDEKLNKADVVLNSLADFSLKTIKHIG